MLRNLNVFHMARCTIGRYDYELLAPVASTLQMITLSNVSTSNMFNLFGSVQLWRVSYVSVTYMDQLRVITSNTIANVPNVKEIRLSHCGIATITGNAFDHLNSTLATLHLNNNQLKTLPAELFDNINVDMEWLSFRHNSYSFMCTCDIMELGGMFPNVFGPICEVAQVYGTLPDCNGYVRGPHAIVGQEARRCYNHYGTNAIRIDYTAPYWLRRNAEENLLLVTGTTRTRFRLIIMNEQNNKCYTTVAKYAGFPLDQLSFGVYLACVVDVRWERKIWPLNCVAVYLDAGDRRWIGDEYRIPCLIGFITFNLLSFAATSALGALIVYRNLRLFRGCNCIALQINLYTNEIERAFVMPQEWNKLQKLQWLNGMRYSVRSPDCRFSFTTSLFGMTLDEDDTSISYF